MRTRSHEEWLAEFNDVVRRYCHSGQNNPKSRQNDWLTWEGAIARLEDLWLHEGRGDAHASARACARLAET